MSLLIRRAAAYRLALRCTTAMFAVLPVLSVTPSGFGVNSAFAADKDASNEETITETKNSGGGFVFDLDTFVGRLKVGPDRGTNEKVVTTKKSSSGENNPVVPANVTGDTDNSFTDNSSVTPGRAAPVPGTPGNPAAPVPGTPGNPAAPVPGTPGSATAGTAAPGTPADKNAVRRYFIDPNKSSVHVTGDLDGRPTEGKIPVKGGSLTYGPASPKDNNIVLEALPEVDGPIAPALKDADIFPGDGKGPRFVSRKITPDNKGGFDIEGDLTINSVTDRVRGTGEILSDDGKNLVTRATLLLNPTKFALPELKDATIDAVIYGSTDKQFPGVDVALLTQSPDGTGPGGDGAAQSPADASLSRYTVVPEKSKVHVASNVGGITQEGDAPVIGGFVMHDSAKPDKTQVDVTASQELDGALGSASRLVGLFKDDPTSHFVSKKITPDGKGGFTVEAELSMGGETHTVTGTGKTLQDDGKVLETVTVIEIDPAQFPKALSKVKGLLKSMKIETTLYAQKDPDQRGAFIKPDGTDDGAGTPNSTPAAAVGLGEYIVVPEKSEVNVTADMGGTKNTGKTAVKEGKMSYAKETPEKTTVDLVTSLELDGALGTAAKTVGLFKDDPTSHFVSKKVTPDDKGGFTIEGDLTLAGETQPVTGQGQILQEDGTVLVASTKLNVDPAKFEKAFGMAKAMLNGLEIDAKIYATKKPGTGEDPSAPKPAETNKKDTPETTEPPVTTPAPVTNPAVDPLMDETAVKPEDASKGKDATTPAPIAAGIGEYIVVPEKSEVNVTADMGGTKNTGKTAVKEGKMGYAKETLEKTTVDLVTSLELDGALGTAAKTVGLFKDDPTSHFVSKKVTPDDKGGFTIEGDLTLAGETQPVTGQGQILQEDGTVLVASTKLNVDPAKFEKAFGMAKAMLNGLEIEAKIYATKTPGSGGGATPPKADENTPETPVPAPTPDATSSGGTTSGGATTSGGETSGAAPLVGTTSGAAAPADADLVKYDIVPDKSSSKTVVNLIGGMKQEPKASVKSGTIYYNKDKPEKMRIESVVVREMDDMLRSAGVTEADLTSAAVSRTVTPDGQGGFDIESELTVAGATSVAKGKGKITKDDGNILEITLSGSADPKNLPKSLQKFASMIQSISSETVLYAQKSPNQNSDGASTPKPEETDKTGGSTGGTSGTTGASSGASGGASGSGGEPAVKPEDASKGKDATSPAPVAAGLGEYIVVPEKSEVNVTADMGGTKNTGKTAVKEGKMGYAKETPEKTTVDLVTSLELDGALGTAAKTVGLFKDDPTSHFVSKKVTPDDKGGFTIEGDLTLAGETQPVTGQGQILQDDGTVLVASTKLNVDPAKFEKAFGMAKAMLNGLEIEAKIYATKTPGSGGGATTPKTDETDKKGGSTPSGTSGTTGASGGASGSGTPSEQGNPSEKGLRTYKINPSKSEVTVTASGIQDTGKSPVKQGVIKYTTGAFEKSAWDISTSLELEGQLGKDAKKLGLFKDKPEARFVSKSISPDGRGGYMVEGELSLAGQTETVKGTGEVVTDDGSTLAVHVLFEVKPTTYLRTFGAAAPMMGKLTLDATVFASKKGAGDEYAVDADKSEVNITVDLMDMDASGETPVEQGTIRYAKDTQDRTVVDVTTDLAKIGGMLGTGVDMIGLFTEGDKSHFVSKKVTSDGKGGFTIEGDLTMGADTAPATGKGEIVQDDGKTLVMHTLLDLDPSKYPSGLKEASSLVKKLSVDATLYASTDEEPQSKQPEPKEPIKGAPDDKDGNVKPSETDAGGATGDGSPAAPGGLGEYIVVPEKSEVSVTADMAGQKNTGKTAVKEGKMEYAKETPEKTTVDLVTSLELDGALGTAAKTVGLFKDDPTSHFVSKKVTPDDKGGFTIEGDLTLAGETQPVTGQGQILQDDGTVLVASTKLNVDPAKFEKAFGMAKAMLNGLEIDAKIYATKKPGSGAKPEGQGEPSGGATPGSETGNTAAGDATNSEIPAGMTEYHVVPAESKVEVDGKAGILPIKTDIPISGGDILYNKDKPADTRVSMEIGLGEDTPQSIVLRPVIEALGGSPDARFVSKAVTKNPDGTFHMSGEVQVGKMQRQVELDGKIISEDANEIRAEAAFKATKAEIPDLPGDFNVKAFIVARKDAPKSSKSTGGITGLGKDNLPTLPGSDKIKELLGSGNDDGSTYIFSPRIDDVKRGCADPREDNIDEIKAVYSPQEEKFFFRFKASALGALPQLPGMPALPGGGQSVLPFKGRYQSSFWLVSTPGPKPLPMMQQFAVLYADLEKRRVTAYVYDGIPGGASFKTQRYLGTFENALHLQEKDGQLTVTMMIDTSELNKLNIGPMWQGIQVGKNTGFWFHSSYNPMLSYGEEGGSSKTAGAFLKKGVFAAENDANKKDDSAETVKGFAKLKPNGPKLTAFPLGFDGPFVDTFITPGKSTKLPLSLTDLGEQDVPSNGGGEKDQIGGAGDKDKAAGGGDKDTIAGGGDKDKAAGGGDKDTIAGGGDKDKAAGNGDNGDTSDGKNTDRTGNAIDNAIVDAVNSAGGPHPMNLDTQEKFKQRRFNWCTFQEQLSSLPELPAGDIVSVSVSGTLYGFTDLDTVEADCLSDLAVQFATSNEIKEIVLEKAGLPPVTLKRIASEDDKADRMFEMLNMDAVNQQFFAYGKNDFKVTITKEDGTKTTAEHTLNVPRP